MKEKRTYSLTAKERKKLRAAEHGQTNTRKPAEEGGATAEEQTMAVSQKRSKRTTIIIAVAIALAVLLIIAAVVIPVTMYAINPYRDYDHVIARFELSNEMVLEYVIEEDEYDIAATNFIFLAENGYFDNTVLFDAGDSSQGHNTDGWVRFGGYEKQPSVWEGGSSNYNNTKHHAQNEKYCRNFAGISNKWFDNVCNKFGYDLNADPKGTNSERLDDIGVLAYLYNDTSTEFQMSYKEQPSNDVSVINNSSDGTTYTVRELRPTMVGYALNNTTVKNLQKIAATAVETEKVNVSSGVVWCPPNPAIYIKKVKVYNLDGKKWDNFDFVSYMTDKKSDGTTRYRGWTGKI